MSQDQIDRTLALLNRTPGWARLCDQRDDLDNEALTAILQAADDLAQGAFAPYGPRADDVGCRMTDGRVSLPEGSRDLWRAYADGGWLGLDLPEALGGSALPLIVHAAVAPLFERQATPLMMGLGAARAGAHLLAERADPALARDWVPRLVSGEWGATICISEPDAGSDVGRIRTRAVPEGDEWRITGEKIWISFGDHDAVERIGHCLLARSNATPGTAGLSLFLVSDRIGGAPNGVSVTRIESKMGMHGSPTCTMSFEGARGVMIGPEGRGLPQLFTMIELMRLQTGCQGLGLATMATETAERYAAERRQGGAADAPPVPIATHAGVAATLARMRARTEILRAASLELALALQAGRAGDAAAQSFASWLLPMFKSFGGEAGFDTANDAIQVLGGAGYTREWPVERALRDARVLTIYEGTTGVQALDFTLRRLCRDRSGLDAFLARAAAENDGLDDIGKGVIGEFAALARDLSEGADQLAIMAAAERYMRAGWLAVSCWLARRLDPAEAQPIYRAAQAEMALYRAQCRL